MGAPAAEKRLRDYADEASTLADLVDAIAEHQGTLDEISSPFPRAEELTVNMHMTARDVLVEEARRISRELEEGLDVLATRMGKGEGA